MATFRDMRTSVLIPLFDGPPKREEAHSRNAFRQMAPPSDLRSMGAPSIGQRENIARECIARQGRHVDDAEVLLTEVINDPSVQQHYLTRVQESLMTIKQDVMGYQRHQCHPLKQREQTLECSGQWHNSTCVAIRSRKP